MDGFLSALPLFDAKGVAQFFFQRAFTSSGGNPRD
jgi:hypothetical protein